MKNRSSRTARRNRAGSAPIEPTTRAWVLESIAGSFAGMYLTLLSIIQGVALAAWASDAIPDTAAGWGELLSVKGLGDIGFRLTTLLAIVVIWHAYFWLSVIARWVPSIFDSVLMFTIGAVEFVPIRNMGHTAWFYGMGALGVLGGFAYVFNARELQAESYEDDLECLWLHIRKYKEERGLRLVGLGLAYLMATAAVTSAGRIWDLVILGLALLPQVGVRAYSYVRERSTSTSQHRTALECPPQGKASTDSFLLLVLFVVLGLTAYFYLDHQNWIRGWLLAVAFVAQCWVVIQHVRSKKRTLRILESSVAAAG